jgi:hypothetical protein
VRRPVRVRTAAAAARRPRRAAHRTGAHRHRVPGWQRVLPLPAGA